MKHMITDIYRIDTMNSTYEIKVLVIDGKKQSVCKKLGSDQQFRPVRGGIEYLEELCIGPSFLVPGVVATSNVQDYAHFVLSTEPKRKAFASQHPEIPEFFKGLADHLIEEVKGQAVLVDRTPDLIDVDPYSPEYYEEKPEPWGTCPADCSLKGQSGPTHNGSPNCKSGSIASGGTRAHCSCDFCY